ncbi:hypothetical protein B277_15959 [Janibacter hoylei PVAS-1]|uniref:Uncharacterized protein n=2 Tax=Janibacter TaxID=53457 RepID=K1E3D8_9MICO|nr:hypothetical protein [Janibacter hoylei]EKA59862.1 hypothetical protein B277_15959 [Janibacter hoylei PVAS-1]RWU81252.1 hypothetical protein CWN80_15190 [Janibacter hoylei PVAS-1]
MVDGLAQGCIGQLGPAALPTIYVGKCDAAAADFYGRCGYSVMAPERAAGAGAESGHHPCTFMRTDGV